MYDTTVSHLPTKKVTVKDRERHIAEIFVLEVGAKSYRRFVQMPVYIQNKTHFVRLDM